MTKTSEVEGYSTCKCKWGQQSEEIGDHKERKEDEKLWKQEMFDSELVNNHD